MNEQIQNKICSKCHIEKPVTEFYISHKYKDGFQAWCKSCMRDAVKKHYENNKDQCKEYAKQYQETHIDQLREYRKNYKNNPSVRQKAKEYRLNNRDKLRDYYKNYYQSPEAKEKRRVFKRQWDRKRRLDPTHRLSNNIRTSMYHALRGKKGYHKWESLVGYTLQDLINHIQPQLKDNMSWSNYGELWQIDHITPKTWFHYQTADDPEFKKCWALENLQPKLKIDNIKKGNRFIG